MPNAAASASGTSSESQLPSKILTISLIIAPMPTAKFQLPECAKYQSLLLIYKHHDEKLHKDLAGCLLIRLALSNCFTNRTIILALSGLRLICCAMEQDTTEARGDQRIQHFLENPPDSPAGISSLAGELPWAEETRSLLNKAVGSHSSTTHHQRENSVHKCSRKC